ncbi:MAG: diacylglycerol kinase family protein [Planctomycetota bacterium]|nr:diacylglycerol kinase family protein [Planctomycetota bacterium]
MSRPFDVAGRIRSFRHAFNGVFVMLKTQHNAWVHLLATIFVCGAGVYFRITRSEWCWLILAIMAVWTAEALNTALEFLADATNPASHPLVGKAKDVAAGAVLISAIGAIVIGILVFGPYLLHFIR